MSFADSSLQRVRVALGIPEPTSGKRKMQPNLALTEVYALSLHCHMCPITFLRSVLTPIYIVGYSIGSSMMLGQAK